MLISDQPAVRRSKVLITTRWGQETTQMKWIILFLLIIFICLLIWFICSIKKTVSKQLLIRFKFNTLPIGKPVIRWKTGRNDMHLWTTTNKLPT